MPLPPQIAAALFWVCVAACAVGQAALLWTAVRREERGERAYEEDRRSADRRHAERWSPDRRSSPPIPRSDSRWRELSWAFLPAVGLALLLAATWARLP